MFSYRIRQNFRGGKLSRLCTKHTIHFQAHAIIHCTQQMIQGENFRDWLKNRKNRESFAVYGSYILSLAPPAPLKEKGLENWYTLKFGAAGMQVAPIKLQQLCNHDRNTREHVFF